MTTISGNTITGTSSNDKINADDLVSDTLKIVTINGGDGDDELSDFITKSRVTIIDGGNGDDLMSGSSYRNATFADFWIKGGYGVDRFYIPGTTSGTPILTRMGTETSFIEHTDIDGSKLSAYVHDSTEIISWRGKDGKAVYYLTEDLSKGRQRAVEFTELYYRTYERPDWYYLARPDTYFEYLNSITPPANTPTYTLTPSAAAINEGATLTTSVATTNVASATTLYYSLSGTGITAADFSAGALTGEGITDSTGKFTFTHTLANDLTTEGAETLNIKLYSDVARTLQVGAKASVSIVDSSIKSKSFNLDVDGDGKITALGDGLMIIRKLFGAAFAGDALTNEAMSPNSTRTTAEIHEFIQQGITTGLLDVDKDGKTTALGDGLMLIRHLSGAAFANEALTNKAISPSSPYFGPPANFAAVAANIDEMRPV